MTLHKFLTTLAPDFMWCTVFDLLIMYEQIEEDICPHVFTVKVSQLKAAGYFAVKDAPYQPGRSGVPPKLYIRIK